jgi:hypothetical protein
MARYHDAADNVPNGLVMPRWSWEGLVEEAALSTKQCSGQSREASRQPLSNDPRLR